jgi:hypothetical protein
VDSQVIELLGRHRLSDELLRAGLEVAFPARDRGVDLIAYADLGRQVTKFVAKPIQMKAASSRAFSLNQKYVKISDLIVAYVWNLADPKSAATFALTYPEALAVADAMGWTKTPSWRSGSYTTSHPSARLVAKLQPFTMTPEKWWAKIVGAPRSAGLEAGDRG